MPMQNYSPIGPVVFELSTFEVFIHMSRLLLVESSASGDWPASGRMATS